jgi:alpha-L-rhamnosidase
MKTQLFDVKMFFLIVSILSMVISTTTVAKPSIKVDNLKCEYTQNPVGIDVNSPRLSWQLESDNRGTTQSAYEIRVARKQKDLKSDKKSIWATGKIESDKSIQLKYAGAELKSGERVYWTVRVWDNNGKRSDWANPGLWEMGLLKTNDWKAKWIEAQIKENSSVSNPAHMFRKEFKLSKTVKSARAYATSRGIYQLELNGAAVGSEVLTPGWTAYQDHIQYQTYNVAKLLKAGDNAIGAYVGDGWYRGFIAFRGNRNSYGEKLALLVQINIEYTDGTTETIITDNSWKASTGPVVMSDIYNGEIYDARLEKVGWSTVGFDDSNWAKTNIGAYPFNNLVAPAGPPIVTNEELKPIEIMTTPKGETVVDMGQNMVGWIRLKVEGAKGTTVKLIHTEVLDKDGNFYIENLRAADQKIEYTLKGDGTEVYEPNFTFQGFRYVKVEGFPGTLTMKNLTGVVVHSDIPKVGSFECSNDMINQLQHNILWGQKGNFVDVPTDCPQRDERLGWTGDAQVFARTACFNSDVAAFYTKWMKDFVADQQSDGEIPHVIPDVLSIRNNRKGSSAAAGWADCVVILPWTLYQSYGDKTILEENYECMKGWVDYQAKSAGDSYFWKKDHTFGDWLSFNTTRSDYPGATTDKDFITQAFFGRSTDLLVRIAKILGKDADVRKYSDQLEKIKKVFADEFITSNGRLSPNTQTAYSLALGFDLLPEDVVPKAAARLAEDVRKFKHITTGFLGTPLICHVLSDNGYVDEAFMLLNRKEYPSWLYPITKGATTIWERWDGIKPDGSFQTPGMNSFNHYAYGAIGEWLYRFVAGIEIDDSNPGYKHIIFQPHTDKSLDFAKAYVNSMYGNISSGWKLNNGTMTLNIEVPVNTAATVQLPGAKLENLTESGKALGKVKGISASEQKEKMVELKIGSGSYEFSYTM